MSLNVLRVGAAVALVLTATAAVGPPSGGEASDALRRGIEAGRLADLRWENFSDYRKWVLGFYEQRGFALAWTADRKPTSQALAAIAALERADERGLAAEDYDGDRWRARVAALGPAVGIEDLARFDLALTVSLMRYVSDLHIGRIHPEHLGFHLDIEPKKYDLSALLEEWIASGRVAESLETVEPPHLYYRLLRESLPRYRELARRFEGAAPLPVPASPVRPGDPYDASPRLAEFLEALGDLPAAEKGAAAGTAVGPALEGAIRSFQKRHGLAGDGVLGKDTLAALNVPLSRRVRQIELTLERWRWLPDRLTGPPIVVNIPAFQLHAFDVAEGRMERVLSMDVIVGKEFEGTRTPVFAKPVRYVVFRPYWEVPTSITRKEILPKLERDLSYATRNDYVIEDASGPLAPSAEALAAVRSGKARIRQKPGEKNALGRVKFMFPNEFNVYLHDTPSRSAFARADRALSHGCIRVSDPPALAAYVLRHDPSWSRERIDAALRADAPETVNLSEPIWVFILYGTAVVDEDGTIHFFRDVYGHDAALDALLRKGYPYPAS